MSQLSPHNILLRAGRPLQVQSLEFYTAREFTLMLSTSFLRDRELFLARLVS